MLDLYYTSVTDVSKPHLEGLSDRNLYVSESLELVIKNVAIVLHSNISCMVVLNSSSSCLDRTLCGETFLNLSIVELPPTSNFARIMSVSEANEVEQRYVGTTLVVCFEGVIEQNNEVLTIEWTSSRNLSHIPLNLRKLATDPMGTCNREPGWHFECNCLKKHFPSLATVRDASAGFMSRYRTYDVSFYDVIRQGDILQKEECLPFPNKYVTILVVDNITSEDELAVTMRATIRHSSFENTFNIIPVYLNVLPVIPPFQTTLYSVDENTNLSLECEGTISGDATLLWRKDMEGPFISYIYYQPNITTLLNVSMICDIYSMGMPSVFAIFQNREFKARSSTNQDENRALVLYMKVALVICNVMSNHSGTYQCLSSDSSSTVRSLVVEVSRPSLGTLIVIIVVCVLLAFLVAIVVIILLSVCFKYRSIKNCPLPMWREEPNSPLVQRPTSLVVPINFEFASLQVDDQHEFPREKLKLGPVLGEGQFGVVHQAVADGICSFDSGRQIVAVKTLKRNARPSDRIDLHSELDTMRKMEPHPNIINFLGVCSKPDNQPLYILMEFAMFGSLKEYLKTVKHRSQVSALKSSHSHNLCPYHYQQVISFAKNHQYRNEQESIVSSPNEVDGVPNALPTPSTTHSDSTIKPAEFAHITRVMKLLSSDYFYSSNNIPAIEIASPSPEPDSSTYPAHTIPVSVSSLSTVNSVYSFDRLSSSSCAYRECPEGLYRSYTKQSPNSYYNTAYDHLKPERKISDVSNTTPLLYPPSYVNAPKLCKCHAASPDLSLCDSHLMSEPMDNANTEFKSRKLSSSSCVYCAQLNRTGNSSYRNLNNGTELLNQSSSGDGWSDEHDLCVRRDGGDLNTGDCAGELSYFEFVDFAHQIARGMEHLEKMKCVHRDLAARNVLIAEGFLLKIGDFGLARDVNEKDYYRKITSGRIPARWMAPESLGERKHTSKSDVWSYGVVLWEILTYGEFPYGKSLFANSAESLTRCLSLGHRLPQPVTCSNHMYNLLKMCWDEDPKKRPAFGHLVTFFASLLDSSAEYLNLTVGEARHRPSAGHLEASALAGLGQPLLYDIEPADSDTCLCATDINDGDHDTTQHLGTVKRESVPMQVLSIPHAIPPAQSSSNLDSEGYLKLWVSSELLDSEVTHNGTSDKVSPPLSTMDTHDVTEEEKCIPSLSTVEDMYPTTSLQCTREHNSHKTKL